MEAHLGPLGAQNCPVLDMSKVSMKEIRELAASSGDTAKWIGGVI
jgi:hypothetical protein